MNSIENERKFLLKRFPKLVWDDKLHINQFYHNGFRYRAERNLNSFQMRYLKIRKVKVDVGRNEELDIEEINSSQFYDAAHSVNNDFVISKTRFIYLYEGNKFEVDVFETVTLIICEIENVLMEDEIKFPIEIQKEILMEVTGIDAFDNYNLAQ